MSLELDLGELAPDFESIRRLAQHGAEYWSARDLMPLLGYAKWSNFEDALQRAMTSCSQFGQNVCDHFAETGKMVHTGSGAQRKVADWYLSRYAAYLIAQNGDPSKPEIAAAQAYFAVQTRRQEMADADAFALEKRVDARLRLAESNKRLASAAQNAGVLSAHFGIFQDAGYKGLYGGKGVRDIKDHKGVPQNEDLSDRMGHAELAANDFRATQTEERLKRERIGAERDAINVHNQVGRAIRQTILDQGNTPPEDLPPEASLKPAIAARKRQTRKHLPDADA